MWRNLRSGLRLDSLRDGPLDKRGAGSRILDAYGNVDFTQIERLDAFAIDFRNLDTGTIERGLSIAQLEKMMDSNYARAANRCRRIDRKLTDHEWPILLRVMGKSDGNGCYLSLAEIRAQFVARRFPYRVIRRVGVNNAN